MKKETKRKLVDIPVLILPLLEILAEKEGRSVKKYMEKAIIDRVNNSKNKKS